MSDDTQLTTVGERLCPDCQVEVPGLYCGMCGRRIRPGIRPVREFIAESTSYIWDVSRDFARSTWELIRRPGQLTRDFVDGLGGWRSHPARLFVNLGVVTALITRFLPSDAPLFGIGPALFGEELSLTAVLVALYALVVAPIAHWIQLRDRRPHLLESFVFVLHLFSFSFLLYPIGGLFAGLPGLWGELSSAFAPILALAVYWPLALYRFGGENRRQAGIDVLLIYVYFTLLMLPAILLESLLG